MTALNTPVCDFGAPAPDFSLPDPSGRLWTLEECRGDKGTLVMFICNHCPFVKAVIDRILRDCSELEAHGIRSVAIMSNDVVNYPQDGPEHMQDLASRLGFPFPYLYDKTQDIAKAYDAVCTPDFFGYDRDLGLQYRGRLDASGSNPAPEDSPRELFEAMKLIAETGAGPKNQTPSMGCSIKWREP
jgi:peroxiredoxin